MVLFCATALLWLLPMAATHPSPPKAPPTRPDGDTQPSAAELKLSGLLGPLVKEAMSQALADHQQQWGADTGDWAVTYLGQLEGRLDSLAYGLTTLQQAALAAGWLKPSDLCGGTQTSQRQTVPEPECERDPSPLPAGSAPQREPAVRACARSCLQLRDQGGSPQDGVYWFTGMSVPTLCDFSHDGGGWTLLLTAVSQHGWDPLSVLGRHRRSPSLTDNYSILRYADAVRDLGSGDRFAYRIEAQAETGRRRWGGVWGAPRNYSFIHESPAQTEVSLFRKFDVWDYKDIGIEKRMPWLNTGSGDAVLTTSASTAREWWGTLVSIRTHSYYRHSPWINGEASNSGTVLYWMREQVL